MTAREAVALRVAAQAAIDAWDDTDTQAPPYDQLQAAQAVLAALADHAPLIDVLADPDPAMRREAANACAKLRLTSAVSALAETTADADSSVVHACACALVEILPDRALVIIVDHGAEVFGDVLPKAAFHAVRALGIGALGWVERSGLVPDHHGHDAWLALYELDPVATTEALLRGLARGDTHWVRGVADFARLHDGTWARRHLEPLLRGDDEGVASQVAGALAIVGDRSTLELLFDAIRRATHYWFRHAALAAVLDLGRRTQTPVAARAIELAGADPGNLPSLIAGLTELSNATWEVSAREMIVRAIAAALGDPGTLGPSAIRAAGAFRIAELADAVLDRLDRERYRLDSGRLVAAVRAYAIAVGAPAFDAIARVMSGTNRELGQLVTPLLADDPDGRRHVPRLRRVLTASHAHAGPAAFVLGELHASEAADELYVVACDAPEDVAYRAVHALVQLRDLRAFDLALARLAVVLAAPHRLVGMAYIEALGLASTSAQLDAALAALAETATDVDHHIRQQTATVLVGLRDARFAAILDALRGDRDRDVRQAAGAIT